MSVLYFQPLVLKAVTKKKSVLSCSEIFGCFESFKDKKREQQSRVTNHFCSHTQYADFLFYDSEKLRRPHDRPSYKDMALGFVREGNAKDEDWYNSIEISVYYEISGAPLKIMSNWNKICEATADRLVVLGVDAYNELRDLRNYIEYDVKEQQSTDCVVRDIISAGSGMIHITGVVGSDGKGNVVNRACDLIWLVDDGTVYIVFCSHEGMLCFSTTASVVNHIDAVENAKSYYTNTGDGLDQPSIACLTTSFLCLVSAAQKQMENYIDLGRRVPRGGFIYNYGVQKVINALPSDIIYYN